MVSPGELRDAMVAGGARAFLRCAVLAQLTPLSLPPFPSPPPPPRQLASPAELTELVGGEVPTKVLRSYSTVRKPAAQPPKRD